jgi:ABC-type amino acid transport substrate-binding protein
MRTRRPKLKLILAALALAGLAACATTQRLTAANDVHTLLVAIRDDDHAAFDAHVDKPALQHELETRILERTQASGADDAVKALGALFARPMAQLAGDALLRPNVFRSVAEYYGYKPGTPIPNQLEIAGALRALPDGRVCAAKGHNGPCLISFAQEGGVWKLVSFDGDIKQLRLPG